jgi:hypothetical protein
MSATDPSTYPLVDLGLARRLERAEALACAAYVETRRALEPTLGAGWLEVAGAHALFDGVTSPLTQTFGLGVFDTVRARDLDELETFFAERGAPTSHEVSALAAPDLWHLLSTRGYAPIEASSVLVRSTAGTGRRGSEEIVARVIREDEARLWSRVMREGVGDEDAEVAASIEQLGVIIARTPGVDCFVAELAGEAVASGILAIQNGVALLGGASTIPTARRRGAQSVLLEARLALAARRGVELAMMVAAPGSTSQRNAERQGFRPVYVRSKWQRKGAPIRGA